LGDSWVEKGESGEKWDFEVLRRSLRNLVCVMEDVKIFCCVGFCLGEVEARLMRWK